jgi:hypothetical protein
MHFWASEVDRGRIEPQQYFRGGHVEVPDLVDFVLDLDRWPEKCDQRVGRIANNYPHLLVPGVLVEPAAD